MGQWLLLSSRDSLKPVGPPSPQDFPRGLRAGVYGTFLGAPLLRKQKLPWTCDWGRGELLQEAVLGRLLPRLGLNGRMPISKRGRAEATPE